MEAPKDNTDQLEVDSTYAKQMFDSPLTSKNDQFVVMNHVFDQNGKPHAEYQIRMHVHNDMTVDQLIHSYLDIHITLDKQSFLKKSPKLVFCTLFSMEQHWTIEQVKVKAEVDRLTGQQFRLYVESDAHFMELQGNLVYEEFQKKYKQNIAEFTIKFQPLQKYLYLLSPRGTLIKELQNKLAQLPKQGGVIIKKKANFTLKYELDQAKHKQFDLKKYKIHSEGNKRFIYLSQYKEETIRNFVGYGETIIVESFKPDSISFQDGNIQNDFNIEIQIYVGNANPEQIQKSKKTAAYKEVDLIQIIIPYSKARTMKVKTLLNQHNIPNYQQISLICQNLYLKPIDLFTKIEKEKVKVGNTIKFIGITQNFLFYKQIRQFCKTINNKTMEQLYQELITKHNILDNTKKQSCKEKVRQRIGELNEQFYKKDQFLNPIVLYTSPLIHKQLNQFARQTSASHFDIHAMLQTHWQFPFSQKLVKSLQVIPNYKGIVYRGVRNIAFNYQANEIVEFNSFTSTSKDKSVAEDFLKDGSIKTLLTIQTFSGKEISRFSFYKYENEVLLFPYTKFKVIKTNLDKTKNLNQIDLLQIPVPKKIPGDIVVWIDTNIMQNSKTFNKIVHGNEITNLQIIQLNSNEHLQDWIRQFKPILNIYDVNIHFITNLNRPPNYDYEGIETLRIIRRLRAYAQVVFYIGDIRKTLLKLATSGFAKETNVRVVNHPNDLKQIVCSWKRNID